MATEPPEPQAPVDLAPPDRVEAAFSGWIHLGRHGPEHVLAAVVGFDFGSRSEGPPGGRAGRSRIGRVRVVLDRALR